LGNLEETRSPQYMTASYSTNIYTPVYDSMTAAMTQNFCSARFPPTSPPHFHSLWKKWTISSIDQYYISQLRTVKIEVSWNIISFLFILANSLEQ